MQNVAGVIILCYTGLIYTLSRKVFHDILTNNGVKKGDYGSIIGWKNAQIIDNESEGDPTH